jgi:hypothetical protein
MSQSGGILGNSSGKTSGYLHTARIFYKGDLIMEKAYEHVQPWLGRYKVRFPCARE